MLLYLHEMNTHMKCIKISQVSYFTFFTCIPVSNHAYRLPLTLTALLQVDLINVAYLMACAIIRSSYISLHFLNDVVNDVKWTRKLKKKAVIIASLKKQIVN